MHLQSFRIVTVFSTNRTGLCVLSFVQIPATDFQNGSHQRGNANSSMLTLSAVVYFESHFATKLCQTNKRNFQLGTLHVFDFRRS